MLKRLLKIIGTNPMPTLLGMVLAFAVLQTVRLRWAQAEVRERGIEKLTLEAAAATTRGVNQKAQLALISMYGRAYTGVERLMRQEQQRADALSRALGQATTANLSLSLRVDSLLGVLAGQGTTETADGERTDTFNLRQPPYTVSARATLPPPPRPGSLRLGITLDTLALHARLGCLDKNRDGLRPASLALIGPTWARMQLDSISQTPEVCNPASATRGKGLPAWTVPAAVGVWELVKVAVRSLLGGN